MSSRAFLCWHCRTCYRSDIYAETQTRRCAECGRELDWVSHKVRVPPKHDVAAWRALRQDLASRAAVTEESQTRYAVRRQHELERQLVELRSRTPNAGRKAAICKLESELARLSNRS